MMAMNALTGKMLLRRGWVESAQSSKRFLTAKGWPQGLSVIVDGKFGTFIDDARPKGYAQVGHVGDQIRKVWRFRQRKN